MPLQHIYRILLKILVCVHLNSFRTGHLQKAQFCIEIVLTVGKASANIYSFTVQTVSMCFIQIHKTATEKINGLVITSEIRYKFKTPYAAVQVVRTPSWIKAFVLDITF